MNEPGGSNPYLALVARLRVQLGRLGLTESGTLVRVSMGEDLERVRRYGTSRGGRSDMAWDRSGEFAPGVLPRTPLRHDDVVIASRFCDLDCDAALGEAGTLAHKLRIYRNPFLTLYDSQALLELMHEAHAADPKNHGRHFVFLTEDKRSAVKALLAVRKAGSGHALRMLRRTP